VDVAERSDEERNESQQQFADFHKALFSVFWQYKVLEDDYLTKLHKALRDKFKANSNSVDSTVRCINQTMEPYSVEIRKGRSRAGGKIFWVLVNALGDKMSEAATDLSPDQLAFFREILDKFNSHYHETTENSLTDTEILNLGHNVNMKPKDAETVLRKFIDELWLEEIERGRIGIGVRCYLEFKELFQEGGSYEALDTGYQ